jgi:hypothetical protein
MTKPRRPWLGQSRRGFRLHALNGWHHLEVAQSLLGIRPVDVGLTVLVDVALDQIPYLGRESPAGLT